MRTVAWRIKDIQNSINSQLKNKASDFEGFSVSLDESADVTNTAQLYFEQPVLSVKSLKNEPLWVVDIEQPQVRMFLNKLKELIH